MGVCAGDLKRKENKNIKIDDFHLSGYLKGKKRKPKDSTEPPKEVDILQNNNNDSNINPKNEENNKIENGSNIIEKEGNIVGNIEPVTKKPEDEKNDENNNQINYDIFIFQEESHNSESKRKELKDNSKYENYDINKDYYLICPDRKFYITKINSVEFDTNINDFKFKYKCLCELDENDYKEKYFHLIISENKLNCEEHNSELKYICFNCKKQICIECKDTSHLEHEINTIINNEVIPESIMNTISDKKDNFKGFDLFEKIFNFYKNYESTPKIQENEVEIKEDKKIEKNSENRSQEDKENKQELENDPNNFINNIENLQEINDDNFNQNNEENKNINESENNKDIDKDKNTKEEVNDERISEEENLKNSKKFDNKKSENNELNEKNDEDLNNVDNKISTNNENEDEKNNMNKINSNEDNKKLKNESDNTEILNSFKKSYNFKIINNSNNANIINEQNEIYNSSNNIEEKDIDKSKKIDINVNLNNSEVNQNKNNLFSKNNAEPILISQKPKKTLNQYKNIKTLKGHKNLIDAITRLSSGYIATGSYDNTIRIWDVTKNEDEALIDIKTSKGYIFCLLEIKPNILYAGNSLNQIDIYDLNEKNNQPDSSLVGHSLWVTSLVKCDEKHFASASNDAKIFIWDSDNNIKIRELMGHTDCILTMILLNNGYLCTGSADKKIRLWNWENGDCLFYSQAHDNWVKCLFQFNDEVFLSGSDDKTIKIWDMNLNIVGVLKGHNHSVRTFCKIGENYFASGSFDKTIKIWDFKEKKCVQTLVGHTSNIICILNYDNKLISCSRDNTIKIWEEI